EPSHLRPRRRPAPPAAGEPTAAGRPDRGGHGRQRRVLLRAAARSGPRTASAVVADELRAGRRVLPPVRALGPGGTRALARVGRVRVADLLLEQLIPQAVQGLIELGADVKLAKHYGGILTERARTGRNGARWQIDTVTSLELRGADRASALAEMTELYRAGVGSGAPVHDWPVPARQRETQI